MSWIMEKIIDVVMYALFGVASVFNIHLEKLGGIFESWYTRKVLEPAELLSQKMYASIMKNPEAFNKAAEEFLEEEKSRKNSSDDFLDEICVDDSNGPDYYTDPAYSFLLANVYHTDD